MTKYLFLTNVNGGSALNWLICDTNNLDMQYSQNSGGIRRRISNCPSILSTKIWSLGRRIPAPHTRIIDFIGYMEIFPLDTRFCTPKIDVPVGL